ncbi:collagen alpha-1(XII) chain-like [Haliotis asinina]|uniref:collagen alpha-1(XII) chain-like n=1 Tax=Haliotis asinina TaxID=109174 RepID=UPI0035321F4E
MLFITLIVASFVFLHQSTAQTDCSLEEKDLIFIIDDSGSISASDFLLVKEFVLNVTETFTISNVTVNVAVITFATFATVEFYLDDYSDDKAALTAAVMAIVQSNGATFTDEALALARTDVLDPARGDRATADNVVILITDDISNDPERTRNESDMLRQFAEIFAVAIAVDDESEINYVGDDPDGEYVFSLSSYSELPGIVDDVGLVTCKSLNGFNHGVLDLP